MYMLGDLGLYLLLDDVGMRKDGYAQYVKEERKTRRAGAVVRDCHVGGVECPLLIVSESQGVYVCRFLARGYP